MSRPRAAHEALTLTLVCIGGLALCGSIALSAVHLRTPSVELLWILPVFLLALAARLSPWWRVELQTMTGARLRACAGSLILVVVILSICAHGIGAALGVISGYPFLGPASSPPAAYVALACLLAIGTGLFLDAPIYTWYRALHARFSHLLDGARDRRTLALVSVDAIPADDPVVERNLGSLGRGAEPSPRTPLPTKSQPPLASETASQASTDGAILPPVDTFAVAPQGNGVSLDLDMVSARIQETLASFNVGARVVDHHCGPVVTQFDIQPDRGVKVKSIVALQNDLALALAAPTIRIQAPVPGKPVVGIEIPNSTATMVTLRELLESNQFQTMSSPLKVVLGKDVAGNPGIIDLAKMPHLLIAGATGSGKSVCVNALISCLLYSNTPDQVRLMMIDPKMVELTVYNGVPHLLSPVVTDMNKVVGVLQWALREMERRYQLFATNTVRNISRYNEKMVASGVKPLPYIVLIVDELADLMMVAPEDVEESICRLAQLARAAGIHLVIATQRPSVDVVTGLIKANFPARIAFAMTSQVDSRTILDSVGAEKLLGRGDMLYMPPDAAKPVRLQGAHVSDQEIEQLVEFWHRSPLQTAIARIAEEEFAAAEKAAEEAGDELLGEAIRTVREFQHASVSLLQRRLKIGYSRAARLMDQLEERGIVGQADGSKQRPVLAAEDSVSNTEQVH